MCRSAGASAPRRSASRFARAPARRRLVRAPADRSRSGATLRVRAARQVTADRHRPCSRPGTACSTRAAPLPRSRRDRRRLRILARRDACDTSRARSAADSSASVASPSASVVVSASCFAEAFARVLRIVELVVGKRAERGNARTQRQLRGDAAILRRRAEQIFEVHVAVERLSGATQPSTRLRSRSRPSCAADPAGSRAPARWSSRSDRRRTGCARSTARACTCRSASFPCVACRISPKPAAPGANVSRRITMPRGSVISSRSGTPSKLPLQSWLRTMAAARISSPGR